MEILMKGIEMMNTYCEWWIRTVLFFQAFAWIKTRTGSARDLRVIVEILMKGIETTWKKDAPGSVAVYKVKTLKP